MPNYYDLSQIMRDPLYGKLCKNQLGEDIGLSNAVISVMTFFEYVLLCWALNSQW